MQNIEKTNETNIQPDRAHRTVMEILEGQLQLQLQVQLHRQGYRHA